MIIGGNQVDIDAGHEQDGLPFEAGRVEARTAKVGVMAVADENVERGTGTDELRGAGR